MGQLSQEILPSSNYFIVEFWRFQNSRCPSQDFLRSTSWYLQVAGNVLSWLCSDWPAYRPFSSLWPLSTSEWEVLNKQFRMSASYQAVSFWAKRAERFNHSISLEKNLHTTRSKMESDYALLCWSSKATEWIWISDLLIQTFRIEGLGHTILIRITQLWWFLQFQIGKSLACKAQIMIHMAQP